MKWGEWLREQGSKIYANNLNNKRNQASTFVKHPQKYPQPLGGNFQIKSDYFAASPCYCCSAVLPILT